MIIALYYLDIGVQRAACHKISIWMEIKTSNVCFVSSQCSDNCKIYKNALRWLSTESINVHECCDKLVNRKSSPISKYEYRKNLPMYLGDDFKGLDASKQGKVIRSTLR